MKYQISFTILYPEGETAVLDFEYEGESYEDALAKAKEHFKEAPENKFITIL